MNGGCSQTLKYLTYNNNTNCFLKPYYIIMRKKNYKILNIFKIF